MTKFQMSRPGAPWDYPTLGFTATADGAILDGTQFDPDLEIPPDAHWAVYGGGSAETDITRYATPAPEYIGTVIPETTAGWLLAYDTDENTFLPKDPADLIEEEAWATPLSASFAGIGSASQSIYASVPVIANAVAMFNPETTDSLLFITLGSSVEVGAGQDPGEDTPGERTIKDLMAALDPSGRVPFHIFNGAINGTVLGEAAAIATARVGHPFPGSMTDYARAKLGAEAAYPDAALVGVVFNYEMNDGASAQFHAGQTFGSIPAYGKTALRAVRSDTADPIMIFGAFPHAGRITWDMPEGVDVTYPAEDTQVPDATTGQSIVEVTAPNGGTVEVSLRHLMVHGALRRLVQDPSDGCLAIDSEPFWLNAIATVGYDALFAVGEFVHPDQDATELTSWTASAVAFAGLSKPGAGLAIALPSLAVTKTWVPAVLQNSWVDLSAPNHEVELWYDADREHVAIQGIMANGNSGTIAFNLPTGIPSPPFNRGVAVNAFNASDAPVAVVATVTPAGQMYVSVAEANCKVVFTGGFYIN